MPLDLPAAGASPASDQRPATAIGVASRNAGAPGRRTGDPAQDTRTRPMLLDPTGPIADDWTVISDGAIPPAGPIIVPHDRLDEALSLRPSTGVELTPDTDVRTLKPRFPRLGLIAVRFPSFADGRGFSLAQRLRALGYQGRLRATGPVIADQFTHLLACGFDEVAVDPAVAARQPAAQWMAQLTRFSAAYQRGRPGPGSILDQRARR